MLDALRSGEAPGIYADYSHRRHIDIDHLAQHSGRPAESPAPETIADHGYRAGSGCAIIRGKDRPAQNRLYLHLLIEVPRNELSIGRLRSTIDSYVYAAEALEREEVFEHMVIGAELLIDRVSKSVVSRELVLVLGIGKLIRYLPRSCELRPSASPLMVSSRSWPGWGTPRCSSNISLATEKMVVLAPMASASEATAIEVKPGLLRRILKP